MVTGWEPPPGAADAIAAHLVCGAEIARRNRVTRAAVSNWFSRYPVLALLAVADVGQGQAVDGGRPARDHGGAGRRRGARRRAMSFDVEPEPTEDDPQLDLDAVGAHYHEALAEDMSGIPEHCKEALAAVPELLVEVRELREDQERWRSLEVESRFLLTSGPPPGPGVAVEAVTQEQADVVASADPDAFPGDAPAVWVKRIYETGWELHVPPPS